MTKADDTLLTTASGSVPISTLKKRFPGKTFVELTQIQENLRLKSDALKPACVMAEMRKDRSPMAKLKKRVEEAEIEVSLIKGLNRNEVKELERKLDEKQEVIDRLGKENNNLYNEIAQLKKNQEK